MHTFREMDEVTVRAATLEDVDAIAEIHVAGYEFTYRGLVPDRVIDARTLALRWRVWSERLAGEGLREFILVAELEGRVEGFTSGRPALLEEWDGADRRVGFWENLYVMPTLVGTGIGFALHEATLVAMRKHGFERAVAFVIDGNPVARFFDAFGWRLDGVTRVVEDVLQHRVSRGMGVSPTVVCGVREEVM
jgi:L-amino acid N-acyltransferase YncA